MATEESPQRQIKGILKNSTSFDQSQQQNDEKKEREMKWDEMNILATYHPADKDYGHMKITDPPTPYNYEKQEDEEDQLDPDSLATKLQGIPKGSPRLQTDETSSGEEETEEDKAHRHFFEQKRKMHYNEFQAVKLARKLMEEEDDDDDDVGADVTSSGAAPAPASQEPAPPTTQGMTTPTTQESTTPVSQEVTTPPTHEAQQ